MIKERVFSLKKDTSYSLIIHGMIIFGLINVANYYYHFKKTKENESLKLIKASVRVDLVAMPTLTLKELKKIDPMEVAVEKKAASKQLIRNTKESDSKEDTGKELKIIKKSKLSFKDMMKNIGSKKVKEKRVKEKSMQSELAPIKEAPIVSEKESKELRKLLLAGNKVNKGLAISGDIDEGLKTELEEYLSQLPEIIRPNWNLPSYLLDKELRCRIKIFIDKNGKLLKTKIHESSGIAEFDAKALNAIKESSPFPELSKKLTKNILDNGVLIGFPL